MKSLFLLIGFLFVTLFAKDNKYLDYTNALIHYNFELKDFDKIKVPMENAIAIKGAQTIKSHSLLKKKIKVTLIAILDKSAYVMINEYLGNSLIKSYKKWVKRGEVFAKYYKVENITFTKIILKYKNQTIIQTLDKKIPGIKEK